MPDVGPGDLGSHLGAELGRQPFTYSIAGVQKSGTSTLQWLLNQHPQVCRPPRKEMGWFDVDDTTWQQRDPSAYAVPRRSSAHVAMGDATPRYLFWPGTLARMAEHEPPLQMIAIFRDPIDRVFSQWMMVRARQPDRAPDWPEMIAWRPVDFPTHIPEEMRGRGERARLMRVSGVVRGYYGSQVEHALALFERSRWLFLDFGDLLRDHASVLARTTDHLGIDRFAEVPQLKKLMAATETISGTAPTADDLKMLASSLHDELEMFAELSGIDISRWTTKRLLTGELDPAEQAKTYAAKAGLV